MSKEQEFHELIEQQKDTKKKFIWDRIESQIDSNIDIEQHSRDTLVLKRNRYVNKTNIIIISIVLFVIIAVIIGILIWKLYPNNKIRYCSMDDYYVEETSLTIKQYGQENNFNILFFDYYDEWDYVESLQYKLKTGGEIVCYQEEIFDINGNMIEYYVSDNLTEMDFLDTFKTLCRQTTSISSATVDYFESSQDASATFEYNGFKYYIKVEGELTQGYVLELVQFLFNTASL